MLFKLSLDIILKFFLSTLKVYKSNYLIGDVNKNDELNPSFLKKSHTTIGITTESIYQMSLTLKVAVRISVPFCYHKLFGKKNCPL